MPKTNLTVLFGRNALNARADFTVTVNAGGEQPLFLASDLVNENSQRAYATYEPDYWLLDGTYKFVPDAVQVGYMSTEMSGVAGAFSTSPVLQFDFSTFFDTNGLTLYFAEATGDYCDDIDIAFYDTTATGGPSLIRTDSYAPTGTTFATGQAVSSFDRIVITFNSTNNPYRYARLFNIDFDTTTRWTGGNIKNGRLIEEIDPTSLSMTSNQIEFTLHDSSGDFSITNPQNAYAALQEDEPIEAYEQVGDQDIFLGRFYLDDWESINENEAHFIALDAIALLGKETFYCSINNNYYVNDLIDQIAAAAGVDITVDASLIDIQTTWGTYAAAIPVMSCRDTLQNALIELGAYATCARDRVINVLPLELASDLTTAFDFTLTSADKGQESPVKLRKAVTAVEVWSYDYSRIYYDVAQEVYNETTAVGTFVFNFEKPTSLYDPTSSTATVTLPIANYGRYWVELEVTSIGGGSDLIIDKSDFFDVINKKKVLTNGSLPSTTPTNVISVRDAWLVKPSVLDTVTQSIYDYYLQRFVQKTKLYGSTIKAGDSVLIDTLSSQQIKGIVERAEFDLTGGFISNVEIVGVIA